MAKEGLDFESTLSEAQGLGYAEANPADDIEGIDAAYKLSILATLAFHTGVRPEDVYHEGISHLAPCDFRYAKELGYAIKLLAIAKKGEDSLQLRVHPAFIPHDMLLAKVDGVFNAVQIEGDLVGKVLFYGEGAGAAPTSSAIVADVISLARNINLGLPQSPMLKLTSGRAIRPISELETRYYLRLTVADRPRVLAQIATSLGKNNISIASVIQKEADEQAQSAELVVMTHKAKEAAMQRSLEEMRGMEAVREIGSLIRVED
jgi:homoserine dehydrogenase